MNLSDFKDFGNYSSDVEFSFISPCLGNPPGDFLTFFEDVKFMKSLLSNKKIKAVICYEKDKEIFLKNGIACLISTNPRITFFSIQNFLAKNNKYDIFKPIVGANCNISKNAVIYNNVKIGDNVRIGNNVVIYPNTFIGDNVLIRDGSIIGADGFEVKKFSDQMLTVEHIGKTVIENDVELKEYVTIHKAVFGWDETYIGGFCKLDSKVHISHGVKIFNQVLIGASAVILGNCIIKNEAVIGANSVLSNRIVIESKSKVTIGSVVTKDTLIGQKVSGNFAIPHKTFMKQIKETVNEHE